MTRSPSALAVSEREACRLLRIGRPALKQLIDAGTLKTVRVGARLKVTRASIDAMTGTPPAAPTPEIDYRALAQLAREFAAYLEQKGATA